jgi:hypothetical protein
MRTAKASPALLDPHRDIRINDSTQPSSTHPRRARISHRVVDIMEQL